MARYFSGKFQELFKLFNTLVVNAKCLPRIYEFFLIKKVLSKVSKIIILFNIPTLKMSFYSNL